MSAAVIKQFTDIPGWFFWLDSLLFGALLETQRHSAPATLVELGTYLGKSAVVIGDHVRPGERFVALDLFGRTDLLPGAPGAGRPSADRPEPAGSGGNEAEVRRSYPSVTRRQFEQNYLALHDELPDVVEGLSASIVDHVAPGTARFVHVDASHLYDQVRIDVVNTQTLLRPGGLAVFDDWPSEHTPGVGAAVWEAVFTRGLIPLALTPYKFYGVYADPGPYREALAELLARDAQIWSEQQDIAGWPVTRLKLRKPPESAPASRLTEGELDVLANKLAARLIPPLDDFWGQ